MSLVTLAEVNDFLGKAKDSEDNKELLEAFILAVTRSFQRYTHREFEPTDDAERVFAHRGGRLFNMVPYDLRSVAEVKTGTDSLTPKTLVATDYRLRPLPAHDGVYQWLRLAADPGECEITVKGDWGFEEVPADVKHWALTTIALWLRRDVQAFERTFNIDQGFLERPEALPSAVRGGLATYARPVLP